MISRFDCPQRSELQQAVLGILNARAGEQIEEHLTVCVACAETAAQCRATDDFLDAIRASPRVTADLDNQRPLLDGLIGRLSEMARIASEPTSEVAADGCDTLAGDCAASGEEELPSDLLAPPLEADELGRLGSYRILGLLGAGGMGIVFEAEDAQLKRRLALKIMKPRLAAAASIRRRFLREAQAAASVEHDNIVAIYQVGDDRGIPYFAMPLLRGQTLADLLAHSSARETIARPKTAACPAAFPLRVGDVLRIGREIAQGLAAAHEHGLMHRDIKPANIWLESGSGRVKILDFGLARSSEESEQITQAGTLLGTPSYMSPEQARGEAVDHRADLFSLGCVLYHMATGTGPFGRRDVMATLLAVTQDQPKPPIEINANLSEGVSQLILQLLAKKPAGRPQSAQEVAERLRTEESRLVVGPQSGRNVVRPPKRRWSLVLSAVVAAICILGVIITIRHKDGTVIKIETDGTVTLNPSAESSQAKKDRGREIKYSATPVNRIVGAASAGQARPQAGAALPSVNPAPTGEPVNAAAFVSTPARLPGPHGLIIDWSASGDLTLYGDSLATAGVTLDANVASIYSCADGSFYYLRQDGTLLLLTPAGASVKDNGVRYGMIDAKGSLVYLRHDGGLLKVASGRNSATRLDDNVRDAFATTRGVVIYIRSDGTVLAMNRNYSGGSALENSISLDTAKRRLIETSHGTYYLRPDGTLLWVALTSPIVKDNGVRYGMADANGNLVYLRHDGVLLKVPPDHNGATKLDLNVRDAFATAHGVVIYTRRDGAVLAMNLNYDGATPLETDISLNTAKQRLKETSSGTYYLRSEGTLLWLAPAGAAVIENGKKPMTEVEPNPAD